MEEEGKEEEELLKKNKEKKSLPPANQTALKPLFLLKVFMVGESIQANSREPLWGRHLQGNFPSFLAPSN